MEKQINLKFFLSKKNLEIQSLCFGLNLFLPTFILVISSLFKNYNLAAELGILLGINIIFTQIFSANLRSIIISENSINNIYPNILFRFFISLIILLVNFVIFSFYEFIYLDILIQITLLILIQWTYELVLTFYEIKNKVSKFYNYFITCIIFCFIIIINFIFNKNLLFVLIFFNILLLLFLIIGIRKINKKIFIIKNLIFTNLKSSAFFSSMTISISNLIWRLLILSLCGKIIAGIYFASFAVGSLPGTLFNNSFGPSMIKKNLKVEYLNLLRKFFYLIIIFLLFVSFLNKDQIFIDNQITQIFGTSASLLGSVFMVKGLYFRQYIIQKTDFQFKIFKYDIYYSILICLIVPTLYFLGGVKLVIFSFFVSSLISFFFYKFLFKKLNN